MRGSANPSYGHKHKPEVIERMRQQIRAQNATRQYDLSPCRLRLADEDKCAYVAGLIDGEGSITRHRSRPQVLIFNTSIRLIEWLVEHVGGTYRISHSLGRSPGHAWGVRAARDVFRLLTLTRPYLVVKQYLADETLACLSAKYGERINGN
jgi:hypothetical protein